MRFHCLTISSNYFDTYFDACYEALKQVNILMEKDDLRLNLLRECDK